RRECGGGCDLVLIGRLSMPEPRVPGVRWLGYLSEEDKLAAIQGARAVLCPSPYESLSIALLEALAASDSKGLGHSTARASPYESLSIALLEARSRATRR